MSGRESNVIPSRADGEGPRNCKLSRAEMSVAQFSIGRSLVVSATWDDSKGGDAWLQAI